MKTAFQCISGESGRTLASEKKKKLDEQCQEYEGPVMEDPYWEKGYESDEVDERLVREKECERLVKIWELGNKLRWAEGRMKELQGEKRAAKRRKLGRRRAERVDAMDGGSVGVRVRKRKVPFEQQEGERPERGQRGTTVRIVLTVSERSQTASEGTATQERDELADQEALRSPSPPASIHPDQDEEEEEGEDEEEEVETPPPKTQKARSTKKTDKPKHSRSSKKPGTDKTEVGKAGTLLFGTRLYNYFNHIENVATRLTAVTAVESVILLELDTYEAGRRIFPKLLPGDELYDTEQALLKKHGHDASQERSDNYLIAKYKVAMAGCIYLEHNLRLVARKEQLGMTLKKNDLIDLNKASIQTWLNRDANLYATILDEWKDIGLMPDRMPVQDSDGERTISEDWKNWGDNVGEAQRKRVYEEFKEWEEQYRAHDKILLEALA